LQDLGREREFEACEAIAAHTARGSWTITSSLPLPRWREARLRSHFPLGKGWGESVVKSHGLPSPHPFTQPEGEEPIQENKSEKHTNERYVTHEASDRSSVQKTVTPAARCEASDGLAAKN